MHHLSGFAIGQASQASAYLKLVEHLDLLYLHSELQAPSCCLSGNALKPHYDDVLLHFNWGLFALAMGKGVSL